MRRNDRAERSVLPSEERSFHPRVKVDREAGRWIAGRLGLGTAAANFADAAVAAGLRSSGGRGGFDHLAPFLADAGLRVEDLRTRYATALAAASLLPLLFASRAVLHA